MEPQKEARGFSRSDASRSDAESGASLSSRDSEGLGASLSRLKDKLFDSKLVRALALMVPLAGVTVTSYEYADVPGFSSKHEMGRTKNSLSAVVAGIVGQKLHGESVIDLEIQKICFPDARVEGTTTKDSIDTLVDLATTSSHFTATTNAQEGLLGTVDKSEFDWKVTQSSDSSWEIERFGLKFDSTLNLTVQDGKITGLYERPGPAIDWRIEGSYNDSGDVIITIDAPFTLSVTLSGTIQPAKETGEG